MNGDFDMDKKQIERQMFELDREILSDLKKDLKEEMSKPNEERDEGYIAELEEMISEMQEESISESRKRSLKSVMKMLDEYEAPKHIKLYKRISVIAACCLILLGLNAFSLKAFGRNMFSAAYQLTKGGINISEPNDSDEPITSESDPYGMKAKCAEYGFFPDTPSYIPGGFTLDHIYEESNDKFDTVCFYYKKNNTKLNFFFTNYKDNTLVPQIGFPTDTYNVTEENKGNNTIYILKEDGQFTAAYIEKRIKFKIFAEGLDYDECHKILNSLS